MESGKCANATRRQVSVQRKCTNRLSDSIWLQSDSTHCLATLDAENSGWNYFGEIKERKLNLVSSNSISR